MTIANNFKISACECWGRINQKNAKNQQEKKAWEENKPYLIFIDENNPEKTLIPYTNYQQEKELKKQSGIIMITSFISGIIIIIISLICLKKKFTSPNKKHDNNS